MSKLSNDVIGSLLIPSTIISCVDNGGYLSADRKSKGWQYVILRGEIQEKRPDWDTHVSSDNKDE